MIKVESLIKVLKKNRSDFYTGVPDSILKKLSIYLQPKIAKQHVIAVNEGAAVSIAIGNYLATKKVPCVYMQNSGLSNALNPLISIANKRVYSIPLVLLIGWRGSPNIKDEPQHKVKGKITLDLLDLLGIKYTILRKENDLNRFNKQISSARKNKTIVAGLIEQGTLKSNIGPISERSFYSLEKHLFLKTFLKLINKNTKIISSTGYNSREILYLKNKFNLKKGEDFYMVGGMGHTSSVALGYSMFSKRQTVCIDGDGSLLMHLGSIKTIGTFANKNLKYVLLNNNSHDSVGGQNTYANKVNFEKLSKSIGFKKFYCIKSRKNLEKTIISFLKNKKLSFLEVKISNNKIEKLPRPSNLVQIKKKFMK